ncbi:MAG: beta-lactamase family protein [Alphaproteobacteria bacterium]|nr:beta-lactamase family protein [Alphaproteobacteria bacterium]MBU1515765.1 beta-lactamase family protein [Alphaproteobacteria bacterium]MBU2097048.1 beta-lactamase family protein [Alphaproteobacteria bacterium]MBU2149564.1 beta-lactamase family protein [Alphaproteobacteria bacterium]MBU2308950.1 beta-lactamase family protein [Alphaproteobacteria bacterium]
MKNKFLAARGAAVMLAALMAAHGATAAPKSVDAKISSVVPGDAAALGFDPAKLAAAHAGLTADVASGKIAGAYLLVGRHGKVAFQEGFGVQGPGQTAPVSDETIFRVFSMTKPIVSVVAMTLVEEGKLDVDAPVSKYLPEYANLSVWQADGTSVPAAKPMLVRHLMSHTSGLIYGFITPTAPIAKAWAAGGENRNDLTAREYAKLIAKLPLKNEPGTAWNYSHSTDVLGAVVEVAGGKTLDVLVKDRVTGPLGMTDTAFWQPEAKRARFAEAMNNGGGGVYYDYAKPTPYLSGGGGLSSTTEDYLRFVLMLAGDGEYKGVRVLKTETLLRMRQDETTPEIRKAGMFFPGAGMGFGLGFSLVTDDKLQRPGNGTFSWWGIAGTEFWVDPKNDVFMVFMVQARELAMDYQRKNRAWIYDALVK